jgi:hypothetical protein
MAIKISLQEPEDQLHTKYSRRNTGTRSILEIMKKLNDNYYLDGGLAFVDVYSRMPLADFAWWISEEGNSQVFEKIKRGWFKNIKLFNVLNGEISFSKKTRVLGLKRTGNADNVPKVLLDYVVGK